MVCSFLTRIPYPVGYCHLPLPTHPPLSVWIPPYKPGGRGAGEAAKALVEFVVGRRCFQVFLEFSAGKLQGYKTARTRFCNQPARFLRSMLTFYCLLVRVALMFSVPGSFYCTLCIGGKIAIINILQLGFC